MRIRTAILACFISPAGPKTFCCNVGFSDVFCRISVLKISTFVL
ncbi:hypothetical protein HMPREF9441_02907 [Paraprevotella clara YIT 11840]|uniref:Uncharacterized protein n=1 Tax=Paraprevotella clara YIT 11840 TaxID=762968 RepID=G5SU51_9BACT|nr:hypothetical protein HMPREF9441_02907 [Paraprevotella clara YIT 11840]